MNFGMLLDDWSHPEKQLGVFTAPFKKREGMPWMQSTARNFSEGLLGENTGHDLNNRLFHDDAEAAARAKAAQPFTGDTGQDQSALLQAVQQWMASNGGGGT